MYQWDTEDRQFFATGKLVEANMQTTASLPEKAARLLESFCEESDRAMGVADPKTFERFCKFAVVAHSENIDLDQDTLYLLLKEKQWPAEQADAAAKRYKAARFLLSMYDQYRAGHLSL
jgi:hypothetical protein